MPLEIPDIDGIILTMAVEMTYEDRQVFGRHLIDLANDILLVQTDTTEQRLQDYINTNEGLYDD